MKVIDCKQNTDEWLDARKGIPTASMFKAIVKPLSGKPSLAKNGVDLAQGANTYLSSLVADRLAGEPTKREVSSKSIERGREFEPAAAKWYACRSIEDVIEVGFCTTDDGRIGYSPDRFVGENGLLEIKVPEEHTHAGYIRNPDLLVKDYRPQILGGVMVTKRDWIDVVSFNPRPYVPNVVVRVLCVDNTEYLSNLHEAVTSFADRLDEEMKRIQESEPLAGLDEPARAAVEVFGDW